MIIIFVVKHNQCYMHRFYLHTKQSTRWCTHTLCTAFHLKCYSFKKVCHFVRMFLLLHYHHIVSITTNDVYNKEQESKRAEQMANFTVIQPLFVQTNAVLLCSRSIMQGEVHRMSGNNHKRNIRFSSKTYANKLMVWRLWIGRFSPFFCNFGHHVPWAKGKKSWMI